MAAYFNETLIPAWITWKKVDEIAHEEKEELIIDFSPEGPQFVKHSIFCESYDSLNL